jgi:hypothetical protein
MYTPYNREKRKRPEAQSYIMCLVCYSVVLLGSETGSLQVLASLLLTGGKGAYLVIRGDVILNTLSARSTSTLTRIRSASTLHQAGRSLGLAELSYATGFDSPSTQQNSMFTVVAMLLCNVSSDVRRPWKVIRSSPDKKESIRSKKVLKRWI